MDSRQVREKNIFLGASERAVFATERLCVLMLKAMRLHRLRVRVLLAADVTAMRLFS